jgi:hypothetical protein
MFQRKRFKRTKIFLTLISPFFIHFLYQSFDIVPYFKRKRFLMISEEEEDKFGENLTRKLIGTERIYPENHTVNRIHVLHLTVFHINSTNWKKYSTCNWRKKEIKFLCCG